MFTSGQKVLHDHRESHGSASEGGVHRNANSADGFHGDQLSQEETCKCIITTSSAIELEETKKKKMGEEI